MGKALKYHAIFLTVITNGNYYYSIKNMPTTFLPLNYSFLWNNARPNPQSLFTLYISRLPSKIKKTVEKKKSVFIGSTCCFFNSLFKFYLIKLNRKIKK